MKPYSWEQVNLLGSCVPVKGLDERTLYILKCGLKTKWTSDHFSISSMNLHFKYTLHFSILFPTYSILFCSILFYSSERISRKIAISQEFSHLRDHTISSIKLFQFLDNLSHVWSHCRISLKALPHQIPEESVSYKKNLFFTSLGIWHFPNAHFTQKNTKAIHINLKKAAGISLTISAV